MVIAYLCEGDYLTEPDVPLMDAAAVALETCQIKGNPADIASLIAFQSASLFELRRTYPCNKADIY